jgi:transcriptional regulator with XRE-family HTH domain
MKLHQVVGERIAARGESLRRIASLAGVDPGNLSRFVSTGSGIGVDKLERLLVLLDIRLANPARPPALAWLDSADHWCGLLKKRLPDMDEDELRQIVVSIVRPWSQRRFILRRIGDG